MKLLKTAVLLAGLACSPALADPNACAAIPGTVMGTTASGTTVCYFLVVNSDGSINVKTTGGTVAGTVAIDQTTPGATNGVQVNAALPAGTNVIGHTINDTGSTTAVTQATGTNLHAVTDTGSTTAVTQATGSNLHAVLDAGAAVIGHVINDASSAVIGHVIADTGSTTAVTQATGSNLHAQLDSGSTTAVTQATGTNLHAVLDTTSTTAVTQATGTNLHAVIDTGSTTAATQATAANFNAQIQGPGANNAAVVGNPNQVSATAQSAETTAATNGQNATLATDLVHKLIVLPYANPENFVSGTTAAMTGTTSTVVLAAPGGSLRNYITNITCVNSHATVGTFVTVQDGSGGTALYTLAAAAVFGGSTVVFPTPLRQPTVATGIFVADVTTGANVICSMSGYKGL